MFINMHLNELASKSLDELFEKYSDDEKNTILDFLIDNQISINSEISEEDLIAMFRDNLLLTMDKAKKRLNDAMVFDAEKRNDMLPKTGELFKKIIKACEDVLTAISSKNADKIKDVIGSDASILKQSRESYATMFTIKPSNCGYTSETLKDGAKRVVKIIEKIQNIQENINDYSSVKKPVEVSLKYVINAVKFIMKGLCYAIEE